MDIIHLAAIDIGSNAVRLLVKHAVKDSEEVELVKDLLVRVPLRLGDDVFSDGSISSGRASDLVSLMKAYKHLMRVYRVQHFRACATAAMREAKNSKAVVQKVRRDTGVAIEVIDGDEEADLIYGTHIQSLETDAQDYLYVDVGGGSTELNFVQGGEQVFKRSFDIGTVRMLHGKVSDDTYATFEASLLAILALRGEDPKPLSIVGSGGNINRIYRIAHLRGLNKEPLPVETLRDIHVHLSSLTPKERALRYNLREDRADVIVPAGAIFVQIAEAVGSHQVLVPSLGLADGIIRNLYERGAKR